MLDLPHFRHVADRTRSAAAAADVFSNRLASGCHRSVLYSHRRLVYGCSSDQGYASERAGARLAFQAPAARRSTLGQGDPAWYEADRSASFEASGKRNSAHTSSWRGPERHSEDATRDTSRQWQPKQQPVKAISVKQLTSFLKSRQNPEQLQGLVDKHGRQFDQIHIAAAFTQLGQWQSKQQINAAQEQTAQQLLLQLEHLMTPQLVQKCECRQLSNMIWASSLLGYTSTPLFSACLQDFCVKLHKARSLQDVSNVLYGLAVCGYEVEQGRLQQLIAAAGHPELLSISKPQNIVTALWAVATMGQQIPQQQAQQMLAVLLGQRSALIPQDISNTLWAIAKMQIDVPLQTLQQLEEVMISRIGRVKPLEVSNTLWACAELLYYPKHLLQALQQQRLWGFMLPSMKPQELASTGLALGALGIRDAQLVGAILQQASRIVQHQHQHGAEPLQDKSEAPGRPGNSHEVAIAAQELCNLCWAVAVLDLQQYIAQVLELVTACSNQWGTLKFVELVQLQQVHLWLQDQQLNAGRGLGSVLTPQQVLQCSMAWAERLQQPVPQGSSSLHKQVFAVLQQLPMTWQVAPQMEQLSQPDGAFSIDISGVTAEGVRLAIEAEGPTHFRRPDMGPTGNTLYRNRGLAARGYVLVTVPDHVWGQLQSPQQRQQYLLELLQPHVLQLQQQQDGRVPAHKESKTKDNRVPVGKQQQRSQQLVQETVGQQTTQLQQAVTPQGRVRRVRRKTVGL